jgi:hypothetical protein
LNRPGFAGGSSSLRNAIAEAIHFFHLDAVSSMVGLEVDPERVDHN